MQTILRALQNEEGQALAEYAMVVGLIAVACVATVTGIGTGINSMLAKLTSTLK